MPLHFKGGKAGSPLWGMNAQPIIPTTNVNASPPIIRARRSARARPCSACSKRRSNCSKRRSNVSTCIAPLFNWENHGGTEDAENDLFSVSSVPPWLTPLNQDLLRAYPKSSADILSAGRRPMRASAEACATSGSPCPDSRISARCRAWLQRRRAPSIGEGFRIGS
jgi:hypothetical protein